MLAFAGYSEASSVRPELRNGERGLLGLLTIRRQLLATNIYIIGRLACADFHVTPCMLHSACSGSLEQAREATYFELRNGCPLPFLSHRFRIGYTITVLYDSYGSYYTHTHCHELTTGC